MQDSTSLKTTWLSNKVSLGQSQTHGQGLFATTAIDTGETVLIWGGSYVGHLAAKVAQGEGKLVMQWDTDVYSIEERGTDDGYFLNHSCDPNVWMTDAYTLVARRPIAAGEELVADYALWEADESYISRWECHCTAPDCRKRITGQDWRLPILQERYTGHFSPLLNKRIANIFSLTN